MIYFPLKIENYILHVIRENSKRRGTYNLIITISKEKWAERGHMKKY